MVPCHKIYNKSLVDLMTEVRQQMGDGPVYISFDIDALDPSIAPGTGRLSFSYSCMIFTQCYGESV